MKQKLFLIFFFTVIVQLVYGQNRKLTDDEINNGTVSKITFADTLRNCEAMHKWFEHDSANHTVFLFLQGGISPVIYGDDKIFENRYKIYFWDFGCNSPDYKCLISYNNFVFNYLTNTYGKKWVKTIRKDVIGFLEWEKNRSKSKHIK